MWICYSVKIHPQTSLTDVSNSIHGGNRGSPTKSHGRIIDSDLRQSLTDFAVPIPSFWQIPLAIFCVAPMGCNPFASAHRCYRQHPDFLPVCNYCSKTGAKGFAICSPGISQCGLISLADQSAVIRLSGGHWKAATPLG